MKYRTLFTDFFLDVDADSEEEATEKAKVCFTQLIVSGEVEPIVWETAGWETEENDGSDHGSALPK